MSKKKKKKKKLMEILILNDLISTSYEQLEEF